MKARLIYGKIEFWLVTLVAAALVLGLLIASKNAETHGSYWFEEMNVKYNFWKHLFVPGLVQITVYYSAFIFLTQFVENVKNDWSKAGSVFGTFLIVATLISITNTYIDGWKFGKYSSKEAVYDDVFVDSFTTVAIIFIIYIAYYILKEFLFNALNSVAVSRNKGAKRVSLSLPFILLFASWAVILIVFAANESMGGIAVFGVGIPFVAIIAWLHFRYLIPLAGAKKFKSKAYLIRVLPIVFLLSLIAAVLCMGITDEHSFTPSFFIFFFLTLFVVLPAIWYIARNRKEKEVLEIALGSSEANLGFLRSQINPHFLFNALNTLYGTALQENADRTGEGIQKLGDMMRFMLHENVQDKIPLAREIEYLNNYIDLQKLRTATSPNIIIQSNIEEQFNRLDISPMLLIPFVENAFKHGISLQQSSFISISLHTKENVLFFDINNSMHLKRDNDPEKMKSGIGLPNVKQRLALLYPKKHELIIRESAKEFFVHLTIQL